ncbi:MAG: MMPL family transporter, partial [Thermoleophilia bacterium]|nr:MMPL family transporter [Thermoleophilia bacterium]
MTTLGPIGRLGAWMADHFRAVLVAWLVLAVGLGVLAPRVETALSGAGWEASGSQSVEARKLIDENFGGQSSAALMVVVHSPDARFGDSAFAATIDRVAVILRADPRVASVALPREGFSISQDGHTAIVSAGANGSTTAMVAAATDLKGALMASGANGVEVSLTGASGMWSDFNEANRSAMMKSELLSWPVTLIILMLAFGSLVAAGLPLMLTILGLVASAGTLYIGTKFFDISIWAMNFALMFALALGIDYALFVVHRFRGAFFGSKLSARDAVAVTMDTAGKAVLFSGATVLISLSAVMLVPSPAFRSMALGIMVSVLFVLLATMTLLPAVLAKLGPRVDRLSPKWVHSAWIHRFAWALHLVGLARPLPVRVGTVSSGSGG